MSASLDNDDMQIKVAIVDDDEGIRTSLSALIRRSSALRLTGDYPDAETALKEIPLRPPDVVLMDINLPGMSGIKAMQILHADSATAHIPVVALSANAMPRDVARGLEAGFFRYLTKPIQIKEFMDTLDVALEFTAQEAHQSA